VIKENGLILSEQNTIKEVREWLEAEPDYRDNFFVVANDDNKFKGIISSSNLFSAHHPVENQIGSLIKRHPVSIRSGINLRYAVELMAQENIDVLPVVSEEQGENIIGVLSYKDIISAYKYNIDDHTRREPSISLKRRSLKILLHGKRMIETKQKKDKPFNL